MSITQHDGKSCPFPHWKDSKGEHNPYVFRRNGHVGYCLPDPKGQGWVWDRATCGDDIICYSMFGRFESGVPIDHTMPTHKNPAHVAVSMFNIKPVAKVASVFNAPRMLPEEVSKIKKSITPAFAIPPSISDKPVENKKRGMTLEEIEAALHVVEKPVFNVKPPMVAPTFIVPPVPAFKVPEPVKPKFVPMDDEWFVGVVPARSGWYEAILDRAGKESQEMLWYSDTSKIWLTTEHKGVRVSNVKAWRGMVKV